jgi:hypothetical protein
MDEFDAGWEEVAPELRELCELWRESQQLFGALGSNGPPMRDKERLAERAEVAIEIRDTLDYLESPEPDPEELQQRLVSVGLTQTDVAAIRALAG